MFLDDPMAKAVEDHSHWMDKGEGQRCTYESFGFGEEWFVYF